MLSASDFTFVYSGGRGNRDHERSLGGPASVQAIVGPVLDNLFNDLKPQDKVLGRVDWRCFYVFNGNATDALYNSKIFISSETAGGAGVDLGFLLLRDRQKVSLGSLPGGGSATFGYAGGEVSADWGGGLAAFAANLAAGLNEVAGRGVAGVRDVGAVDFTIEFSGSKAEPVLTVPGNTLGVAVVVSKEQTGSPVNTVAVQVDTPTTPPSGVALSHPTADDPVFLGNLFPGDGFPVWVRRTLLSTAEDVNPDGFTVRLSGEPVAAKVPPPPPAGPDSASFAYAGTGGVLVSGAAVASPSAASPCASLYPSRYTVTLSGVNPKPGPFCNCESMNSGHGLDYDGGTGRWEAAGDGFSWSLGYDVDKGLWTLNCFMGPCGDVSAAWEPSSWSPCQTVTEGGATLESTCDVSGAVIRVVPASPCDLPLNLPATTGQCTSCCEFPVPHTLEGKDLKGTFEVGYTSVSFDGWVGCHRYTGPVCSATIGCGIVALMSPVSGTAGISYAVECLGKFPDGSPNWRVTARWSYSAYYSECVVAGNGSRTKKAPISAYVPAEGSHGECAGGTGSCSDFFEGGTVNFQADTSPGGGLVLDACVAGGFSLTATFPTSYRDPNFGILVPSPAGKTVTFKTPT